MFKFFLMLMLYILQRTISCLVQLISIFASQHPNSKILAMGISLSDLENISITNIVKIKDISKYKLLSDYSIHNPSGILRITS